MYEKTEYLGGEIHFTISQKPNTLRCPCCGIHQVTTRGTAERRWRGIPIGSKAVWIQFHVPCVHCQACGVIRQVKVSFAKPGKRFTNAFVRCVLELRQLMTIKDVACFLNISWNVVKDIDKACLLKHFGKPRLGNLR